MHTRIRFYVAQLWHVHLKVLATHVAAFMVGLCAGIHLDIDAQGCVSRWPNERVNGQEEASRDTCHHNAAERTHEVHFARAAIDDQRRIKQGAFLAHSLCGCQTRPIPESPQLNLNAKPLNPNLES